MVHFTILGEKGVRFKYVSAFVIYCFEKYWNIKINVLTSISDIDFNFSTTNYSYICGLFLYFIFFLYPMLHKCVCVCVWSQSVCGHKVKTHLAHMT